MKRVWHTPVKVLSGLLVTALYAMPQAYTISARTGAINYIEGTVALNGQVLTGKMHGTMFMGANDVLSTKDGKAEVLLTPGVFLRLGSDAQVRMISPALTNTKIEILQGSAMLQVGELLKENDLEILDSGATIRLQKTGLYRFTAGNPPLAQTLDGKAQVVSGERKVEIGKDHQTVLSADLKSEKIQDSPKDSDLYAWSKVRDEYDAASSYAAAKNVSVNSNGGWAWAGNSYGMGYGYGFGALSPGWAWNPLFGSYAWLPMTGAFYSPFGFGYYSPVYAAYAPYAVTNIAGHPVVVPVNPSRPGTSSGVTVFRPNAPTSGIPVTTSGSSIGAHPAMVGARASVGSTGSGGGMNSSSAGGRMSSGMSSGMGSAHSASVGGGAHR